jgi:2,4-dienoyl-CoA reductase-like NADH-dependent reductase (Old Yellow Enzyme family)
MADIFDTYDLAGLELPNRIVMAPLTRSRAVNDIADEMTALYYTQRATAALMISEGSPISREGQGYLFNPGIFSPEQISGWRKVTTSVHGAGGRIFAQLWHVGRVSHESIQLNGVQPVSSTSKVAKNAIVFGYNEKGEAGFLPASKPRQLTTDEVVRVIHDFGAAAENAMTAGFDGVELHAANGYIFEQFLNPLVNDRSDRYSANTLENRLRFTLEVVEHVSAKIGAHRVGIRFSPYGQISDIPLYSGIEETYLQLGRELAKRNIAYIHLMDQSDFKGLPKSPEIKTLLQKLRAEFDSGALILAGGQTVESANQLIGAGTVDLVAFGQLFISNPDLVARFEHGWPLAQPDPSTYYGGGAQGYIDYPAYAEETLCTEREAPSSAQCFGSHHVL